MTAETDPARLAEELAREVERRRRAEADLEQAVAELRRSNVELEQFAYVASHDLQEPLRAIGGYAQLLARRYHGKLDSDADEFIAFMVEGVRRMQTLIHDLLHYGRVGRQKPDRAPVALAELLQRGLRQLEGALRESGAEVTGESLPTLSVDAGQITQLFQNLVGNAIKYRSAQPPRIRVSAARERAGTEWTVSVQDNGLGIDPKYFPKLFVPFQRLHTHEQVPGSGIGLALCKRIVEGHGGRIWAESEPHRGATFRFTIPAGEAECS